MKITKQELTNIIKEEVEKALSGKDVNEVDVGEPNMFPTPTKDPLAGLPRMIKRVARAAEFTDNLLERLEDLQSEQYSLDMKDENRARDLEQDIKNLHAIAKRIKGTLTSAILNIKSLAKDKDPGIFVPDAKKERERYIAGRKRRKLR